MVALNREIVRYNESAAEAAAGVGARFVDVGPAFVRTAELLCGWAPSPRSVAHSLRSDGLHPSELGVDADGEPVTGHTVFPLVVGCRRLKGGGVANSSPAARMSSTSRSPDASVSAEW